MTILWKALAELLLMVQLVFLFDHFLGEKHFMNFFLKISRALKSSGEQTQLPASIKIRIGFPAKQIQNSSTFYPQQI
jgi:hypothetical protein